MMILLLIYAGAGLLFAAWFYRKGIRLADPDFEGSTPGFKVMVFPCLVLLFPLLMLRIISRK